MIETDISNRIILRSRCVGGNPTLVPVADFVLRNEILLLLSSVAEALDMIRTEATPHSQDHITLLLQDQGFEDIADIYQRWCKTQNEE